MERGAAILAHMTSEYSTKLKLLSLGTHQLLLPLIAGADPDTQRHALTAVGHLVELHQARQPVAEERGEDTRPTVMTSRTCRTMVFLLELAPVH